MTKNPELCLIIEGAAGRMGQTLIRCAQKQGGMRVVAAHEKADHPDLGRDAGLVAGIGELGVAVTEPGAGEVSADVMIDFTFHAAVPGALHRAVAGGQGVVLGTTGLNEEEVRCVKEASAHVPVVWAPNMSLGVNVLLELIERTASLLGPEYDIEITEMHHRHKKDAPSGTALALAESAARGRGVDLKDVVRHGREGMTGERPAGEIGMHALRGGDVVGDHEVMLAADGERIALSHRASSREAFAMGALKAARWLKNRAPGRYDMRDVLGLHPEGDGARS